LHTVIDLPIALVAFLLQPEILAVLTDPAAGDPQYANISSVLEQVNALGGTPSHDVSNIFLL